MNSSITHRVGCWIGAIAWWFAGCVCAAEPIVIPEVYDPSPVIDGDLREWDNRGVLRELNRPEQVTYGRDEWKGLDDLSGDVRFGYNEQDFFVAARIVDSFFIQDQSGTNVWRGDHVMVTLDFIRGGKIDDVMQLGLSPGSLAESGATQPELVIWRPAGYAPEGARVAARRTADGYVVEAAIPWGVFKITPVKHQVFGLQFGFSDSDSTPSIQQSVMSISTAPWEPRDPNRLTPAGLGDRSGNFPASGFQAATTLAKALKLKQYDATDLVLELDALPEGMIPTLAFKARIDHASAGGCSGPLRISVNGQGIGTQNIANRPAQMTAMNGIQLSAWYDAGVRLWFGPDYDAIESSPYKPLDVVSYDYLLRLDGMFEPGRNVIKFENVDQRPEVVVIADDVRFSWSPPSRFPPPRELRPAPVGELPTIEPRADNKVVYEAADLGDGRIELIWQGRKLHFQSCFASPDGPWSGQPPKRELVKLDECLLVRDTLANPSATEDRPVMISHTTSPGPYRELWLSGRPMPTKTGAAGVPSNPSIVVLAENSGFAMMPRDDIFRIHYRGRCDENVAELTDPCLILRPGVTYRHEWLIFPLDRGDYWQFVNAARRHFDTNFPIHGSFYFGELDTAPWKIVKEIEWGGVEFISVGPQDNWKGMFPHGPFMATLDQSKVIAMHKTIKAVSPETRRLHYFNCFNRSTAKQKEDPEGWADCQVRMPDGSQVTSGPTLTFYFPTLDNAWGREMDKLADWMIHAIGADGLYWDCYDYWNVTHYAEPWDGWTADIDPKTLQIQRKRSCLTLISWPWREKLTSWLLSSGRPLVANGNPSLTSEYRYRFPRFVETADISNLSQAHLFTPIALGDHVTERNEVDSFRWMLSALDWGGLYYWYNQKPSRPAFTAVMFPFTPIELHRGYLIGEERILTKDSGLIGWGDASNFEVHVFDRLGRQTDEIQPPRVMKDGKAYAEVRIPEGYAAAIVRGGR